MKDAVTKVVSDGMLHNMAYPEASIHCLNTDTTVIGGIGVIGIALNLLYDRLRG